MAYWVHVENEPSQWRDAKTYNPPAPSAHGRKGFPVLCIDLAGVVFRFSSNEQIAECVRVLSRKSLPTTRQLSTLRGSGTGPNSHWLSRLPATVKAPKIRAKVAQDLSHFLGKVGT